MSARRLQREMVKPATARMLGFWRRMVIMFDHSSVPASRRYVSFSRSVFGHPVLRLTSLGTACLSHSFRGGLLSVWHASSLSAIMSLIAFFMDLRPVQQIFCAFT